MIDSGPLLVGSVVDIGSRLGNPLEVLATAHLSLLLCTGQLTQPGQLVHPLVLLLGLEGCLDCLLDAEKSSAGPTSGSHCIQLTKTNLPRRR